MEEWISSDGAFRLAPSLQGGILACDRLKICEKWGVQKETDFMILYGKSLHKGKRKINKQDTGNFTWNKNVFRHIFQYVFMWISLMWKINVYECYFFIEIIKKLIQSSVRFAWINKLYHQTKIILIYGVSSTSKHIGVVLKFN